MEVRRKEGRKEGRKKMEVDQREIDDERERKQCVRRKKKRRRRGRKGIDCVWFIRNEKRLNGRMNNGEQNKTTLSKLI